MTAVSRLRACLPFRYLFGLVVGYVLWPVLGQATHIVGGELTYTCLGNNQYEIRLTIFRDCYNGNPQAWFDDPASIGIFNAQSQLVQELLIPWDEMLNDTLNPMLSDECFVVPPDVCVHTTTYSAIVTLPPLPGGYILAYQRCCRNGTISNIVDPLAVGSTYMATISEKALLECNSGPQFNAWPPLYICVNEPIWFDQSAYDADGDSLVYRLCTPLNGASPIDPMPQPPAPPPYQPVPWLPPYDENNMLNGIPGGDPLAIDPHTGLLTGLPNTIGQFVVGICLEEYRDGVLIGTYRRDFQYNVGVCGQTTAAFFAPEAICGQFEVTFVNLSEEAESFFWIFSQDGAAIGTSTDITPTWIFPDTGWYDVTLIAAANSNCVDTFTQSIHLLPESLIPNFTLVPLTCTDSVIYQVYNTTVDTLFVPASWTWLLNDTLVLSHDPEPQFVFYKSGTYQITLQVTNTAGCSTQLSQWLNVSLIDYELPADSLQLCAGQSVLLNNGNHPALLFYWSPASSLDDSLAQNPVATPSTSTLYVVTITDIQGNCSITRQVWVEVWPLPQLGLTDTLTSCDDSIMLYANWDGIAEIAWATQSDFDAIWSYEDSLQVSVAGNPTWYVQLIDIHGCTTTDSVLLLDVGIQAQLVGPHAVCPADTAYVTFLSSDSTVTITFAGEGWQSDLPYSAWLVPEQAGGYGLSVNATNAAGCTWSDTFSIFVPDTTNQSPLVEWVPCAGTEVAFSLQGVNAAIAHWLFGDPDHPTAQASGSPVSWDYGSTGTYLAVLTFGDSLTCLEPVPFLVTLDEPGVQSAIDAQLLACDSMATGLFVNATSTDQPIAQLTWFAPADTLISGDSLWAQWVYPDTLWVGLAVYTQPGCRDTAWAILHAAPIAPPLPDSALACNFPTALTFDLPPGLGFLWAPPQNVLDPTATQPTVLAPGTYIAQVHSLAMPQCQLIDTVHVFSLPPVQVTLPADTASCGEAISLNAMTNLPALIQWYVWPDTANPVHLGPNYTWQPTDTNVLIVEATHPKACPGYDTVEVVHKGLQLSWYNFYTLCRGQDTLQLALANASSIPWSVSWQPQEAILTDPNEPVIAVSPLESTLYQFEAVNAAGCTAHGIVQVEVFARPFASMQAFPTPVYAGQEVSVTLENLSFPSIDWYADPSVPFELVSPQQVTAVLQEPTTFVATVTDFRGCMWSYSLWVPVLGGCVPPYVYVPNTFSPNGDGINDQFQVYGPVAQIELVVYDRWGEEVFRTTDVTQAWDGTFQGRSLPPDVYAWQAWIACVGGKTIVLKGNVTLLR